MENQIENLNSLNEETLIEEFKSLDEDARVAKFQEILAHGNKAIESNKHLFTRAKDAEGKVKELRIQIPEVKPEVKPEKSDDFGLLQKTYLRAAGVVAEDEVELAKDLQKKTGLDWDKLTEDDYFKSKLEGLRTAKANANATSNIRGSAGDSGVKQTSESLASDLLKFDGALPDMPKDPELFAKAIELAVESKKSGSKGPFYNSK